MTLPQDRFSRHVVNVISKALAHTASDLCRSTVPRNPEYQQGLADIVQAAARVFLANREGSRVYWYGPATALTLARADLEILFEEADTLANALGDDPSPDTEESEPWHGPDEPTSSRGSDNE